MSESDLDRLYRRASAQDSSRPDAAARKAILDQARQLAAQAQEKKHATPARASRWRSLLQAVRWQIAAPVAAALLAGILLAPQWRSSQLTQVAPTSANIERAPPLAAPQAAPAPALAPAAAGASVPAPARVPPPPAASAGAASEEARSAPAQRRQSAAESSNAAAAINARDANGRTALMIAVMHAQLSLVRALLARGADPNIADARGRTPLAVARIENRRELIDVLVAAGAR